MKITLTLAAGIELNDIQIKGLSETETQRNWDWSSSSKQDHGRRRESHNTLESISGSANGNFNMNLTFDLEPEELKECHSYIKELTKTVVDSHSKTAEAVKDTAKVVEKTVDLSPIKSEFCFPECPAIEIVCRDFYQMSDKAHKTKNIADINTALIIGHIAEENFKEFGYAQSHKASLEDIQGTIKGLKALKEKVETE